jgi:hyperosmotically inducible protein
VKHHFSLHLPVVGFLAKEVNVDFNRKRTIARSARTVLLVGILAATFSASAQTSTNAKAERRANRALAHAVRKSMEKNHLEVDDVRILAKDGAVTLAGTLDDQGQLSRVSDVVKKVPGVTSVDNELTLQQEGN